MSKFKINDNVWVREVADKELIRDAEGRPASKNGYYLWRNITVKKVPGYIVAIKRGVAMVYCPMHDHQLVLLSDLTRRRGTRREGC